MPEQTASWDVAIIGGGGAGLAIAAASLEAGRRVVLFERGTLAEATPVDILLAAARRGHQGRAWPVAGAPMADPLAPFAARGVTVVRASAHFIAPRRIEAAGRAYPFRHAVIAAGRAPVVPALYGLAGVPWLTASGLLALEEAPEHLLVLGGGAQAVEIAQAQALLGHRVSLVQTGPNILPGEDLELVVPLRDALRASGVALHENADVLSVETAGAGIALLLEGGARLEGSHLLLAVGEAPRLSPLDLAAGRIEATPRGVAVGPGLRSTSNRRVWAVGSIADTGWPVAAPGQHAAVVADAMLRGLRSRLGDTAPPRLVRSQPALAQAGMTEAEAKAAGREPQVVRVPLEGVDVAKLVADPRGRLLGASLLAAEAGEISALLAVAIGQGMSGRDLAALPLPRSTTAAAIARAAGNLRGAEFPSSPKRRIFGALDRWL
jgi:pyruvate/2-oxoglutarate dehydrogenase complex dihydrolipoamide dehydrogenase (E3) component